MRFQALRAVGLAVVVCVGAVAIEAPAAAAASPRVRLFAGNGPPTSTVMVSGSGFGAHRAVDIYFGSRHEAQASTNGAGAFSGVAIRVPASARPGEHRITVVARHSSRRAQARFLVNTNWAQFRYTQSHSGFNPFENVLSRSNVSGVKPDWRVTGQYGGSSPTVANGVVYIGSGNGRLYALDAATGAKLWSFPTGSQIGSSPAVANGVIYIASRKVLSFDLP
jgi:hypothetical protein